MRFLGRDHARWASRQCGRSGYRRRYCRRCRPRIDFADGRVDVVCLGSIRGRRYTMGPGCSLVPAYMLALRRVVVTDTTCLLLVWALVSGCSLSMGLFLRWGSIRGIGTVGITAELDVHPGWIQQYLRTAVSLVAVSRPLMQMDLSLTLAFADAMETYLAGGSVSVVRSEEQRWEPTRALCAIRVLLGVAYRQMYSPVVG
ncbi:hypothetical protein C8F04DRAFT_1121475 [Mycena alexandri]|uniref:Uncharacterized protein n=1 Tax=Mycena alexandri TaxID=1745969 RepID=A0AAD6SLD7_9AGAR|nr:hypothetical protein C8F04DRAFT_1121475 [Mycena alexandri]